MSVLNKNSIQQLRSENKLVIEPFTERNLGPNSYDVTLGDQYYLLDENLLPEDQRLDLRRKEGPDDDDTHF